MCIEGQVEECNKKREETVLYSQVGNVSKILEEENKNIFFEFIIGTHYKLSLSSLRARESCVETNFFAYTMCEVHYFSLSRKRMGGLDSMQKKC